MRRFLESIAGCAAGVIALGSAAVFAAEPAAPAAFTAPQVIETWGWLLARDKNLAGIEVTDRELSGFLKGFAAATSGQPAPLDLRAIYPDIERVSQARREKLTQRQEQMNEAAARTFFDALKKNNNAAMLANGVGTEVLAPGSGPPPRLQQTVNVHYTARLIDGTEFSQLGPVDLVLVTNRSVCRGWIEALQRIGTGGRVRIYVPPPLSRPDAVRWGIEPGSAMIFDVELFTISDTSPQDLENSLLPPAPEPEPPAPSGHTDLEIIEAWGWDNARQTAASRMALSETELASLTKGLRSGIRAQPPPFNLSEINSSVRQFITTRREQTRLQEEQKRRAEMKALFARLKENTNVVELPDGLRYEILLPGHGPYPRPGQIVRVDYTARLLDGTVFDKTYNEPLNLEVGSVIDGWNEGVQKINIGGRIRLYIPPSLGYGTENHSGVVAPIPGGSVLIYEIELLGIEGGSK